MALSPLQIELIDDAGAPVGGATIEVRHELTAGAAVVYNRDGSVLAGPHLTDANGSVLLWLVNGIYEWRSTVSWTTDWKAFRAFAGFGAEGFFSRAPAASMADPLPTDWTVMDTLTVPSFGVETQIGSARVTVDFAFNHMRDVKLTLWSPGGGIISLWDGSNLPADADDYAFDGEITLVPSGGLPQYTDPITFLAVEMVDGGTYTQAGLTDALGNTAAAGAWTVQWDDTANAFTPHTGVLRSWSLELVPV